MKSLIAIYRITLEELGVRCGTSTIRDWKTVTERVEHEGLSFLTITLANFGKDLQKGLDQGYVDHDLFPGFARTGGLPRFLGGFLDRVFDRSGGRLLDDPCVESIRALRQLTLMFAKVELECSPRRVRKAFSQFVECEQDVRRSDAVLEPQRLQDFTRIGRLLWADLFSKVDARVYYEGVTPKHSSGATADRIRGNLKYVQKTWTRRLEEIFPHWDYLISSPNFLDELDDVTILEPGEEMPVRVITVPKTLKTPRIIAIEPTCMQYMQQGILEVMTEELRKDDTLRSFVSSESQEPNRDLAKLGSLTGALATLDLSEASDRVSNQHVRALLANHRWLATAVDATRSRKAEVPGHGVLRLAKFASMGSALCFPFESIVFLTIVFLGIERELRRNLTHGDVRSFVGSVRVYGDDIIVPVRYVQSVVAELSSFGMKVNTDKSFWTGRFRESCGADYYDGHDVSVVRVRSNLPTSRKHVRELESTVSLRNQLFEAGLFEVATHLDNLLEGLIPFPEVGRDSALLGRHTHEPLQATGHDNDLQIPLVRGVVAHSVPPDSHLDGYGALLKWFLKRGEQSLPVASTLYEPRYADRHHLVRAGRPVTARIKNRWSPLH